MQKSTSDGGTFKDGLLEVRYEYSPRLPVILQQLNATLLVTTYQAGKLMVLGTHGGQLHISFLDYDQPMGLAVSPLRIALGSRRQIHFFVPAHETQSRQQFHDGCFVPRSAFYTGTIHGHELGWGRDGCWIVNTLFSCLSTLHDDYSFVPRWRPPFVTELIDQDRCHLNGLALEDGRPKYVTAMGQTDSAQGWRLNKATGGSVLEVPSGQVICDNLAMPHSPRLHGGQLWVLDSGHGTLNRLDVSSGKHEIVERLPGYTRGLSFCGQFAFVGLSKIRETSVFGGIPIADRRDELRCGIGVVELISGNTVAVFQFHSGVSEIFAVEVLAGFSNPLFAGASVNQQDQEVWIVPNPSSSLPQIEKRLPLFYGRTFSELPPESGAFDSLSLQTSTIHDSTHSAATLVERGNLLQEQGNQ
ncbi:MAG: TIGR03032 family protein, partial [Planctomycetales bacterium]|nr:TIGR03032 family protein [Planctomycetales bacterium]